MNALPPVPALAGTGQTAHDGPAHDGSAHPETPTDALATDVDVVIVSYESRDLVLTCLASLSRAGTRLSVTVVDNASHDGTVEAVRAAHPRARVISMGRNAGFSRANNRGFAGGRGRYVFVLNPDTVVAPHALTELVHFADLHPTAGVIAPRLVNPDGSDQLTARAFPTPAAAILGRRSPLTRAFPRNRWSTRYLRSHTQPGHEPFEVDWVSGAAMLVPRHVLETVGGLDEDFFLFWEDADWCRRIKAAGYQVWCVPHALVVHDEGGTRGHGWSAATIRSFHVGAYRYWRKHNAPQPWNPLRWTAAGLLTLRAAALIGRNHLLTRDRHPVPAARGTFPTSRPTTESSDHP